MDRQTHNISKHCNFIDLSSCNFSTYQHWTECSKKPIVNEQFVYVVDEPYCTLYTKYRWCDGLFLPCTWRSKYVGLTQTFRKIRKTVTRYFIHNEEIPKHQSGPTVTQLYPVTYGPQPQLISCTISLNFLQTLEIWAGCSISVFNYQKHMIRILLGRISFLFLNAPERNYKTSMILNGKIYHFMFNPDMSI